MEKANSAVRREATDSSAPLPIFKQVLCNVGQFKTGSPLMRRNTAERQRMTVHLVAVQIILDLSGDKLGMPRYWAV
jgi:hypothetical protein